MDDRVLVAHMIAYIEEHLVEPIAAEDLAVRAGYSLNRLRQKSFNVTGDTPSGYLRKRRLTESAKEILRGARPTDVALKHGYSSAENFTTAFRSYFGVTPMEIANLKQPPLNTTPMGCIKGASDYFDGDLSAPMLFGLTGHAFVINIHKDLHAASPYVWNKKRFKELLAGIGIDTVAEHALKRDTPEPERRALEESLRGHLAEGRLCMLNFLENQLFSGYDETGFLLLTPWGGRSPSEVPALIFGSWEQCLEKDGWAHFTALARKPSLKPIEAAARDALEYAQELSSDPRPYEVEGCRMGDGAYENWIAAVERGLGSSHGHWWNGIVWSECRQKASESFGELGDVLRNGKGGRMCASLKELYAGIAGDLAAALKKDLAAGEQLRLLRQARDAEAKAASPFRELVAAL